jgi:O-antigen ligase
MSRIKESDEKMTAISTEIKKEAFLNLKQFFVWISIAIVGLGILVVLGNYIFSALQPYRGPSKAYFWFFLILSLCSERLAIWLFVFCLPLMANFHIQLALITNPAVKYFFVYPGIDAIVGLVLGLHLHNLLKERKLILARNSHTWPFGLFLIILIISTALAVSRNLWQTASEFSFTKLIRNIFEFKLIDKMSDYLPITDLIVFIVGIGLVLTLIEKFKDIKDVNSYIFKPLVLSLFFSALCGIMQALTSWGLDINITTTRPDFLGFGAIGFQPDIHAYAGLMSVGAVGLIGYYKFIELKAWRVIFFITIVLSWIAIILSKSRASFFLAFLMLLSLVFISLWKRQRTRKSLYAIISIFIIALLFNISKNEWFLKFYDIYQNDKQVFFEVLNLLSSWRLDLHSATLHMWSQFPLMGVGLGNLFRVSSIYEFSGSALMPRLGGENAHNYFFQLLTEIGLIGFATFLLILILPLFIANDRKKLIVVYIAIISLFLGNIYSHSFIVRENLFLLMILLAALYGNLSDSSSQMHKNNNNSLKIPFFVITLFVGALILLMGFKEIITAYNKTPFIYGRECYRISNVSKTAWKNGRYEVDLPPNAYGVSLTLERGDVKSLDLKDLPIRMYLFDRSRNWVETDFIKTEKDGDIIFEIRMPNGKPFGDEGGVGLLTLVDCMTADHFNLPADSRNLFIDTKSIGVLWDGK